VRHFHKFYNNVIVAGIYTHHQKLADFTKIETYVDALSDCLRDHPFLAVVLKKTAQNDDVYAQATHVDFRQHFHIIETPDGIIKDSPAQVSEDALFAHVIEQLCNDEKLTYFDTADTLPGWRLDVLPLNAQGERQRMFVSFTYAHYIADGMSGVAFHKSLLAGLDRSLRAGIRSAGMVFETPQQAPELACLPHLPISPMYLLAPALGLYLPSFLSKALGLKPSVSGSDSGTWTGTKTFVAAPGLVPPVTTAVEVLSIEDRTITAILGKCRKHNAKLTSLLNELIARSLGRHLSTHASSSADRTNFISATSINLRKAAGISDNEMGIFASASYTRHEIEHLDTERDNIHIDDAFWTAVGNVSQEMAKDASKLKDQPVGLLNWVANFDSWMEGQLGKSRDGSWQLSNLMSFNGELPERGDAVSVEKMFFCQPGHAVGEPLDFNVISTKGGDLVICVGWQVGAIGLDEKAGKGTEAVEHEFVRNVLRDLERHLVVLAEES